MKLLSVLDHSSRLRPRKLRPGRVDPIDLSALAARIDRDGIDAADPRVLSDLARRGQSAGLHPEVAAAVADPSTPAVVRLRVFGLIHRRLMSSSCGIDPADVAA